LWGYGTWWAVVAILTTLHHARTEIPFNMGWWGLTFPLGVYTAASYALGRVLAAPFFTDAGAVCTLLLLILWSVVAVRTAHGIWHGHIFHAPCLVDAPATQVPSRAI
jgi:tellurite resistance protein TehA-like permease